MPQGTERPRRVTEGLGRGPAPLGGLPGGCALPAAPRFERRNREPPRFRVPPARRRGAHGAGSPRGGHLGPCGMAWPCRTCSRARPRAAGLPVHRRARPSRLAGARRRWPGQPSWVRGAERDRVVVDGGGVRSTRHRPIGSAGTLLGIGCERVGCGTSDTWETGSASRPCRAARRGMSSATGRPSRVTSMRSPAATRSRTSPPPRCSPTGHGTGCRCALNVQQLKPMSAFRS